MVLSTIADTMHFFKDSNERKEDFSLGQGSLPSLKLARVKQDTSNHLNHVKF
jgi:hypothetical protein